jgi:ceroid-lipofuscinosis protein 6
MDLTASWFPLNHPSMGDYFHMLYNICTPVALSQLMDGAPYGKSSTARLVKQILLFVLVMGASIHLVGDSVNHRLRHVGYKNSLSVRENPIIKLFDTIKPADPTLHPEKFVLFFELLYNYDERIGHLMWYIPFFIALVFYVWCCRVEPGSREEKEPVPSSALYALLPLSSWYYW